MSGSAGAVAEVALGLGTDSAFADAKAAFAADAFQGASKASVLTALAVNLQRSTEWAATAH
eukprot:6459795-Amphidinium_carterae.1